MTVGILTFHNENNIGAVLQSLALQKYIDKNICNCEIIDFIPNNSISKTGGIHKFLHLCKWVLTLMIDTHTKDRYKKFALFRHQYYKLSVERYYGDNDIIGKKLTYDFLISGSDQILNLTLSGNSKSYYLAFCNDKAKISYASSFGREHISNEEHEVIKAELPKFVALSAREQSAIQIIKNDTGREATLVLDPTFLLDLSDWEQMEGTVSTPEHYIFVYAMEYSTLLEKTISGVKQQYRFPVLCVPGNKSSERLPVDKMIKNCGPTDFLGYIHNADIIITNSFHGTAFSLIYRKKFYCVSHSTRNTRLENIMDLVENRDNLITDDNIGNKTQIAGDDSYQSLIEMINRSKNYLCDNIKSNFR
jgi:polysaccharide pyruvyl transferase WcaK-like protein